MKDEERKMVLIGGRRWGKTFTTKLILVEAVVRAASNLVRDVTKGGQDGPWIQAHDMFLCYFCGADGYKYESHHKPSCLWWKLEKAVKLYDMNKLVSDARSKEKRGK
jgi:hypothetical protein